MLLLHLDQWTVCDGEMTAADVACPFCEGIGGIRLSFNHREARFKAGYLLKLADLRSGRVLGTATCMNCGREIPRRQWPETLVALFNDNKYLYKVRASFRIGKIYAALNLALVGWFAYVLLSPLSLYGSLESYGATPQRIERAMKQMAPGTVFLIFPVTREGLLGKGSNRPTPGVYMLVRVEAAEGDKVKFRLHKTSWTDDPLVDGLEDSYRSLYAAARPENFSADEITVTRDEVHRGFVSPVSAVPITVRSVVVEPARE